MPMTSITIYLLMIFICLGPLSTSCSFHFNRKNWLQWCHSLAQNPPCLACMGLRVNTVCEALQHLALPISPAWCSSTSVLTLWTALSGPPFWFLEIATLYKVFLPGKILTLPPYLVCFDLSFSPQLSSSSFVLREVFLTPPPDEIQLSCKTLAKHTQLSVSIPQSF